MCQVTPSSRPAPECGGVQKTTIKRAIWHEKFPSRRPVDGPRPERDGGDVASSGRADRNRGDAFRRHRRRRRGGGLRAIGRDRAAVHRDRRRLLRAAAAAGRGQDHSLQRFGPCAEGGDARLVYRAQAACDPADIGARRHHPGLRRRLGDHPARSRQARVRYPAATGDQGRRGGLCGLAAHRLRLEEPVRETEERHQHRALFAAARQARGRR